ncbi:MAG: RNA methyltransferase [Flavobacteriales bacterium]|nr:RNA methyltransferase [Flavobacteriales bacterium]
MNIKLKLEELNRIGIDEFNAAKKTPIIVIADDLRSLNNIGSLFRTGDAFRIEKIYLAGITATPPHRDITKTALGSTKSVRWEKADDLRELVKDLKSKGVAVYAIEQTTNSIALDQFQPSGKNKTAIIFGNEVSGVQQSVIDLCDGSIEVPQIGTKHSLNIAVCAGIVIWELYQKLKKAH